VQRTAATMQGILLFNCLCDVNRLESARRTSQFKTIFTINRKTNKYINITVSKRKKRKDLLEILDLPPDMTPPL
jgi:hypothetical protein